MALYSLLPRPFLPSKTLLKPRWPINASEGSHLFLISSHFFNAESVMTLLLVSIELEALNIDQTYLWLSVVHVEIGHIHTT
jgi:hypothetical protein